MIQRVKRQKQNAEDECLRRFFICYSILIDTETFD